MWRGKIMNRVSRECFILWANCSLRTSRAGDEGFLLKQLSVLFFFFLAALYLLGPHSVQPGTSTVINWPMSTVGEKKNKISGGISYGTNLSVCCLHESFLISSMSTSTEFLHHQPETKNTPKNLQDTGINIYLLFPVFWLYFYLFPLLMLSRGHLSAFWQFRWKAFSHT